MEQKWLGRPDLQHICFLTSFGLFLCEPALMVTAQVFSECAGVCARTYVRTVTPQDRTACGQQQANIVFLVWLPCQGSSFPWKDEHHGLKNERSISKAIKGLAEMVNQHAHWYKLGWRAHITHSLSFSQGP